MKFQGFSRIIPAIAAMLSRGSVKDAKQAVSSPVKDFKISSSGGYNTVFTPPKIHTSVDSYIAKRNQKKRRKNARRAAAAGDPFAFSKKH
jgi:hypothetical protein